MKSLIFAILAALALVFFVLPLTLCYFITGRIKSSDIRKICNILFKD